MKITNEVLRDIVEEIDDLKMRIRKMVDSQQETIEREENSDMPSEDTIEEMEELIDVLEEVGDYLDSAFETLNQVVQYEDV